jgi:hypothetical protein
MPKESVENVADGGRPLQVHVPAERLQGMRKFLLGLVVVEQVKPGILVGIPEEAFVVEVPKSEALFRWETIPDLQASRDAHRVPQSSHDSIRPQVRFPEREGDCAAGVLPSTDRMLAQLVQKGDYPPINLLVGTQRVRNTVPCAPG